jgi:UDP-N-acetylglucosamine:LPS N-acetylglucosamine transferase
MLVPDAQYVEAIPTALELLNDQQRMASMAAAQRDMGLPGAAEDVARMIIALAANSH